MIDKSKENWAAGQECLTQRKYNAAANRFYYSVFQAILWYALKKKGYEYKRGESKIHGDMNDVLAKDEASTKMNKRVFKEFMILRQTADYQPETPRESDIRDLLLDGQLLRDYYLQKANT